MVRLVEGYEALEEDRNSTADREMPTDTQIGGTGAEAGKARARRANPHRKRGAVRDSDLKAAEKFASENGLAYN